MKNGVFRYYKMGRDKDSIISFIKEQKWKQIESISSWKSPNSIQMSVVAQFFKLSQKVRVSIKLFFCKCYIFDVLLTHHKYRASNTYTM